MRGVIPNSFAHIFQSVKASKDVEFLIRCSYLELYNEEIKDLLCNPKAAVKCELKEDVKKGIFIKGLTDVVVENEDDLNRMLDKGLTQRTTASTNMNAESSRSHSIFTVIVEMSTKDADGKEMLRVGKLNLVDLAGSERQNKTGAVGAVLKEGIKINMSLTALGNVIQALSEGSARHIPYRDSKLTRLLQDSLGGNTKTMMIAAISPADYNYDETMSTLRYANRAKNIKNKPKINEDPKDAVIREYKDEIEKLRRLLLEKDSLMSNLAQNGGGSVPFQGQPPSSAPSFEHPSSAYAYNDSEDISSGTIQHGSASHNESFTSNSARGAQDDKLGVSFPLDGFHQSSTGASSAREEAAPSPDFYLEEDGPPVVQQQAQAHQSPSKKQSAPVDDSHHEQHREILRQKESEIEAERRMREELAQRLEQLEHLLVNNHHEGGSSPRGANMKKLDSPVKAPPSKEEREQEEEALKKYKERRVKAKKKREAQQQQEMQRIMEEKRSMEEELEELRQSAVAASNNNTSRAYTPNTPITNSSDTMGDNSATLKKMARMKKRYEKRLGAALDELNDMRDDFYYQRKQLMDAMVEQEKDTKLYESICQSLLSERDLKKIVDRCRFDEECDEWVVPFLKKKNVDHLDSAPIVSSSVISGGYGGSNFPKMGGNNSSMLPDIAGRGQALDKVDMSTVQVLNNNKINGSRGDSSARNESKHGGNNYQNDKPLIVPLLSLPGGMVTSASLMSPAGGGGGGYKQQQSVASSRLPADINGSTNDYTNGSESGRDAKKSSKPKNKIPKMPTANKADSQQQSGGSYQQQAQQNTVKMPSLTGNGHGHSQPSGRASAEANSKAQASESKIDEQGTGEHAGPLDDWGFLQDDLALGGSRHLDGAPELEYSDDEDFESSEGRQKQQQSKGKKKKKKKQQQQQQQYDDNNNGYNNNSSSANDRSTPRQQQFSLPKI
eukprot:gene21570-27608_t